MRKILMSVSMIGLLFLLAACMMKQDKTIPEVTQTQFEMPPNDMRNYRYCEVIPVFRKGQRLNIEVYATIGLNQCPDELWNELDAEILADTYGAVQVIMNGPRYWVLNSMVGEGESITGKTVDFGGIEMTFRARIERAISDETLGSEFYVENEVQRSTTFTYLAGNTVYELISAEGEVYRMQSYSQIVDPSLTIDDLETLGDRLDLPEGWAYEVRVLEEDEFLVADGLALVITDELSNSYQKIITD